MKKIFGTLLMASALSLAYAEGEAPQKGQMLEEAKAHATQMIDMRIKVLQESKACISAAQSKEDMQKCRQEAKNDRQEIKGAHQEKRKEWKQKREEWKNKRKEMKGGPKPGEGNSDAPPAEGEG